MQPLASAPMHRAAHCASSPDRLEHRETMSVSMRGFAPSASAPLNEPTYFRYFLGPGQKVPQILALGLSSRKNLCVHPSVAGRSPSRMFCSVACNGVTPPACLSRPAGRLLPSCYLVTLVASPRLYLVKLIRLFLLRLSVSSMSTMVAYTTCSCIHNPCS